MRDTRFFNLQVAFTGLWRERRIFRATYIPPTTLRNLGGPTAANVEITKTKGTAC